ncbi:hypothetical protein V6N13_083267 [Hibiscus sabdariffa]|uniref:FAR1 domain-containing protein n=1 Tax=Hibiscus sabdariffa TaxID=183260 RepID=A0ABR2SXJ3_9ROSI
MYDYDTIQEPYVGMVLESEGAAKAFYDAYARQVGFLISSHKSERDGLLFSRGLGCREESRKTLDEEKDKKIQELSAELRVKKRLNASYREQLVAFVKEVWTS